MEKKIPTTTMLYSTKRKWDKLMNNNNTVTVPKLAATASRASTPTSSAVTTAPKARTAPSTPTDPKKHRANDAPLSARPSIRAVSPTDSVRSARSTVTTASTQRTESKSQSAYTPWDRDAFLERLGSFRFVDKWTAKPVAVNEVAWAKRGWICSNKNRVRCNTCRIELLVQVESDDEQTEGGREVIKRYEDMIINEHDELCLWRRRGCDEQIYRLQMITRPAFTSRYNSLTKIRPEIPPSLSYPEEVDPAALHYPSDCMNDGPIFETAAMLALFGWENQDPGIPSLVTCSTCFRRLGLWLFKKKPSNGDGNPEASEASVCRLDLVGEHRDYCPWVNADSQGKEPGWRTLLRVLRHSPKSPGAASTYSNTSTIMEKSTIMTNTEQDAEDDNKLKKLRRLKTLYFGKGSKKKEGSKGRGKGEADTMATLPAKDT